MHARFAHVPHLAAPRYRALGIVLVVHLALGWWLLGNVGLVKPQAWRPPLAPVLIQDVVLVSPALQLRPKPSPQHKPPGRPLAANQQPFATTAPARSVPRPEPVPRSEPVLGPAAPVVRDFRPGAATAPAAPPPMASTVAPSVQQVPEAAALLRAGQPTASPVATPSSAPAATPAPGLTRSGPVAPPQPQANVLPRSSSGAAAPIADIALVCPTQVAPVMPRLAKRGGITGVVLAQAVIVDGAVRDVRILSGPPVFHNAVREAMRQYRCESRPSEVLATQEFVFNFER